MLNLIAIIDTTDMILVQNLQHMPFWCTVLSDNSDDHYIQGTNPSPSGVANDFIA